LTTQFVAHKLCSQPDCLVDTDLDSGQINPVLPAKGAPVFHKHILASL